MRTVAGNGKQALKHSSEIEKIGEYSYLLYNDFLALLFAAFVALQTRFFGIISFASAHIWML